MLPDPDCAPIPTLHHQKGKQPNSRLLTQVPDLVLDVLPPGVTRAGEVIPGVQQVQGENVAPDTCRPNPQESQPQHSAPQWSPPLSMDGEGEGEQAAPTRPFPTTQYPPSLGALPRTGYRGHDQRGLAKGHPGPSE